MTHLIKIYIVCKFSEFHLWYLNNYYKNGFLGTYPNCKGLDICAVLSESLLFTHTHCLDPEEWYRHRMHSIVKLKLPNSADFSESSL